MPDQLDLSRIQWRAFLTVGYLLPVTRPCSIS